MEGRTATLSTYCIIIHHHHLYIIILLYEEEAEEGDDFNLDDCYCDYDVLEM